MIDRFLTRQGVSPRFDHPQGINWDSPQANGLIDAIPFWAKYFRRTARGIPRGTISGSPLLEARRWGTAFASGSTSGVYANFAQLAGMISGARGTILSWFSVGNIVASQQSVILWTGDRADIMIDGSTFSRLRASYTFGGTGYANAYAGTTINHAPQIGQLCLGVGTWTRANGNVTVNAYLIRDDGNYYTGTATGAVSEWVSNIFRPYAGGQSLMSNYESRVYNRALTLDEIFKIYDPATRFELYSYSPVWVIPFVAEAAGGPTYTLTAAAGSFALTGQASGLKAARKLVAAAGSFSVTGVESNLRAARKITAGSGSYTLSGIAAGLQAARKLLAASGSYTLTGQAAGLRVARVLVTANGAYVLTGVAADLVYTPTGGPTYTLVAAAGSFTLTGQASGLRAARVLAAAAGTYSLTGQAAGLRAARVLLAGSGSYSLTGQAALLRTARVLLAANGSYVLTGQAAVLTYSGLVVTDYITLFAPVRSFVLLAPDREGLAYSQIILLTDGTRLTRTDDQVIVTTETFDETTKLLAPERSFVLAAEERD